MDQRTFPRIAPPAMYGRDMSRPGARLLGPSVSLQPLRPARNPKEQFEPPRPLSEQYWLAGENLTVSVF